MKRSYLGGLRVKLSPTNVTLRTIRFHDFPAFSATSSDQHTGDGG
jgi:hypothetical protein